MAGPIDPNSKMSRAIEMFKSGATHSKIAQTLDISTEMSRVLVCRARQSGRMELVKPKGLSKKTWYLLCNQATRDSLTPDEYLFKLLVNRE